MKPCRECGNECAESAKQCPKCGAERPTKTFEELLKRAEKKKKKQKQQGSDTGGVSINVVESKSKGLWWKIPLGLFLFTVLVMGVVSLTTDELTFSDAMIIAFLMGIFGIPLVLLFTFVGLPIILIIIVVFIVSIVVYMFFVGWELAQFALLLNLLSELE